MEWPYMPVTYLLLAAVAGVQGYSVAHDTELRTALLSNYSLSVRPQNTVTVGLLFNAKSLTQMSVRDEVFSMAGYFTMVWNDSRLTWASNGFGNIDVLFALQTEIWRPALIVENSVENLDVLSYDDVPMRVTSSGQVTWNPPGIFKVQCDVDITFYPFDAQECYLSVQSWGYNLKEVDLEVYDSGVDTSQYQDNGEWNMMEASVLRRETTHDSNDFANMRFKFRLERKPIFYGLHLLLPVLINSLLIMLVFALPPESGEKLGYALTVLLSLMVLLTLVAELTPTSARTTSYMGVYISLILLLGGLSVLLTIIILKIFFKDEDTRIPSCLASLGIALRCMLCSKDQDANTSPEFSKAVNGNDEQLSPMKKNRISPMLGEISEPAKPITWKELAYLLDSFFLRLYVLIIVAVTLAFFLIMGLNLN